MSFTDTGTVGDLHLRSRISIKDDDGNWIKGKVSRLAYVDEDTLLTEITLDTKTGPVVLRRLPSALTILEWGDDE